MPRPYTATRVKRGKWARYNARRAANREADRLKRQKRRAERQAESERRLLAHAAQVAANPLPLPSPAPSTRLRVTVEIGDVRRVFSAHYIAGIGWVGESGNTITRAIRLAMANTV